MLKLAVPGVVHHAILSPLRDLLHQALAGTFLQDDFLNPEVQESSECCYCCARGLDYSFFLWYSFPGQPYLAKLGN